MVQRIIDFILSPWRMWQEHRAFKKRLEELRKRDPFIYK
jgi:hypothetical protein